MAETGESREGRKVGSRKLFPYPPFRMRRPVPPVSHQATSVMFWDIQERLPWKRNLTSGQGQSLTVISTSVCPQ